MSLLSASGIPANSAPRASSGSSVAISMACAATSDATERLAAAPSTQPPKPSHTAATSMSGRPGASASTAPSGVSPTTLPDVTATQEKESWFSFLLPLSVAAVMS